MTKDTGARCKHEINTYNILDKLSTVTMIKSMRYKQDIEKRQYVTKRYEFLYKRKAEHVKHHIQGKLNNTLYENIT